MTPSKAACDTIKASRWTIFLARLFGKKVVGTDDWGGERVTITFYRWRGVLYMTGMVRRSADAGGASK